MLILINYLSFRGIEPGAGGPQSRSHTPDPLPASGVDRAPGPSPTMQQRIKAIGVPTPLAMSSPVRR